LLIASRSIAVTVRTNSGLGTGGVGVMVGTVLLAVN
jgi:hypothetical protein